MAEMLIAPNPTLPFGDGCDFFGERRLSDLLPTDFLNQIGLDPNSFIFGSAHLGMRRASTPSTPELISILRYPRRMTENHFPTSQNSPQATSFYRIDLSGMEAYAYASSNCGNGHFSGCLIEDGPFRRFASIIERIPQHQIRSSPYEIVSFDVDMEFGDFIQSQSQIALTFAQNYVKSHRILTEIISVENVSYQARSLLRVQVQNENLEGLDGLSRFLIQIFGVAVQIFEADF